MYYIENLSETEIVSQRSGNPLWNYTFCPAVWVLVIALNFRNKSFYVGYGDKKSLF